MAREEMSQGAGNEGDLLGPDGVAQTRTSERKQRSQVTGAQLEQQFSVWVDGRRQRSAGKKPPSPERRFRRAFAAVLTLGLVALAVLAGYWTRADELARVANDTSIRALETELAGASTGASIVTTESVKDLSTKATAAANRLKAKQNRYAYLYAAMNDELASEGGNGAPSKAMVAIVKHRRDLAGHWSASSLVLGDRAYDYSSVLDLPEGKIDPRLPWYVRFDGMLASNPKRYGWRVEAVMPQLKTPGAADVVWVNRQADGTVLAWSSAVYDGGSGLFSELELVVTDAGIEHGQTAGSADQGDKEGIE